MSPDAVGMDQTPVIIPLVRNAALRGAAISSALFDLLSTTGHAPREVYEVAKAVSDLSVNVSRINHVWPPPGKMPKYTPKPRLERQLTATVERIAALHDEIQALIDPGNAAARLLWAFRRARWRSLLLRADAYIAGISIISNTLVLADQLKKLQHFRSESVGDKYITTTRQQLESLVQILHQSILTLSAKSDVCYPVGGVEGEKFDAQGGINYLLSDASDSLIGTSPSLEDTATWLYNLVFSSTAKGPRQQQEWDTEEDDTATEARNSHALIHRHGMQDSRQNHRVQSLIHKPFNARIIVNTLLSKWTSLSKRDVYMTSFTTQAEGGTDSSSSLSVPGELGHPSDVHLTDARYRKYRIPWDVAKTWVGMEGFIYQLFCRTGLWPRVLNEQFDLLGENDIILRPQIYDRLIQPGASLVMRMWALEPTPSGPPPPLLLPGRRPTGRPMPPPPAPERGRTRRAANSSRPVHVGS
ncbi:hypothetical protein PG994_000989 [Apiospora phragmitis]|uniref:Ubiquitin-like domain-containing protein n=1 Tax=Apiospora phragmitis TaxID=2905665 RepID=A0ABR1WS82_9PEZI